MYFSLLNLLVVVNVEKEIRREGNFTSTMTVKLGIDTSCARDKWHDPVLSKLKNTIE